MSEAIKPTPGPCWVWVVEDDDDTSYMTVFERLDTQGRYEGVPICRLQSEHAARLIAEAGTVFHETGLSPRQLAERYAELVEALICAQQAINSMKVEAETAAQGDEQMMLEACETISNEGLQADMAIRAALAKCQPKEATP